MIQDMARGRDEVSDVLSVVGVCTAVVTMLIAPLWILDAVSDRKEKFDVITAF
jgi:hypothetical protein